MSRFYVVFLWLLLLACQTETRQLSSPHQIPPQPAFYHWKSTFAPTKPEQALLRKMAVQTLYIRFFDVDWDAATRQPVPTGVLTFRAKPTVRRVVPVVFITNKTLLNLPPGGIPALAQRIVTKVQQMTRAAHLTYPELQLDCDWTRSTRTRYFALLRAIAADARVPLSATVRLHQVRYVAQTGVPPVSRGMLMAYNIGDWKRPGTRNSIFDPADLRRYADYLPGYPMPLDVALPLFRWTVMFRNGKVLALRNNLDAGQLRTQPFIVPDSIMPEAHNRFVVSRDTTSWGVSLRRGDRLRAEACLPDQLLTGRSLILSRLPDQTRTFTLYHLDSTILLHYTHAALTALVGPAR